MRLVILSDTHGLHNQFRCPDGDVLIHAGDCTDDIGQASLRNFLKWFESHPQKHKILIAGNHDGAFEKWPDLARAMVKEIAPSVTYLQDSGCEIGGYKFWGSPVTPEFCNWHFNRERGEGIKRHWDMIPRNTDVLITHGPAWNILDKGGFNEDHCGCRDLRDALEEIQPRLHIFGHIHYSYGHTKHYYDDGNWTDCINASIWWHDTNPLKVKNAPFIFDLP